MRRIMYPSKKKRIPLKTIIGKNKSLDKDENGSKTGEKFLLSSTHKTSKDSSLLVTIVLVLVCSVARASTEITL